MSVHQESLGNDRSSLEHGGTWKMSHYAAGIRINNNNISIFFQKMGGTVFFLSLIRGDVPSRPRVPSGEQRQWRIGGTCEIKVTGTKVKGEMVVFFLFSRSPWCQT